MTDNAPGDGPAGERRRSAKTEERLSGRAQRKIAADQAAKRRQLWTVAGIVGALALAAALAFYFTRERSAPPVAVAPAMDQAIAASGRTMGDPDAPVKVVEWGDYQ